MAVTNILPEAVINLLSQFTFVVDLDSTTVDLMCILCCKIMVDPYQTYCGCQYCRNCIVLHLSAGDNYCCGSKEECKEDILILEINVGRSALLNRKIITANVYCPNQPCSYSTRLTQMEDHMIICPYKIVECPCAKVGCNFEAAPKMEIASHIKNQAFEHSQLLMASNKKFDKKVRVLQSRIRSYIGVIASIRAESRTHSMEKWKLMSLKERQPKQIIIRKRKVSNELDQAVRRKSQINAENTEEHETTTKKTESSENMITTRGLFEEISVLIKGVVVLQKSMSSLTSWAVKYREYMRKRLPKWETEINGIGVLSPDLTIVGNMNTSMGLLLKKVNLLSERLEEITSCMNRSTMLFPVGRFSAKKGTGEKVHSEAFYTHTNGYRLRLSVTHNRSSVSQDAHLSVNIIICKGENDDRLKWPLRYTASINILNQQSGKVHMTLTHSYTNYIVSPKPDGDIISFGQSYFISNRELESVPGLVVEDSVLLTCVVRTSMFQ